MTGYRLKCIMYTGEEADHSLVTEGISRLASIIREKGSRLETELQFLLHRGNEHEAAAAADFASSLGIGFRIKSIQVLDIGRAGEWMPGNGRSGHTLPGMILRPSAGDSPRYLKGRWPVDTGRFSVKGVP
jgi:hypothetical protein